MSTSLYNKIQQEQFQEIDISAMTENNFLVVFSFLPEVMFWAQTISFPGISMPLVATNMPHGPSRHYDAGTAYNFDPIRMTFLMDERMTGWTAIFDWITNNTNTWEFSKHSVDATVLMLTNAKKPYMRVAIENLIPQTLEGFNLDSRLSEVVTYSASFLYSSFSFHPYKTASLSA